MTLADVFHQYGWLIFGAALVALEMILPGVFLVFFGVAALVVGSNVLVLGGDGFFGWWQQIFAFLALTGLGVLFGRRRYGAAAEPIGTHALNRRADSLVGRRGVLVDAIVGGRGRMAIDDGWWEVEGEDLPVGRTVRVAGSKGSLLLVDPVAETVGGGSR